MTLKPIEICVRASMPFTADYERKRDELNAARDIVGQLRQRLSKAEIEERLAHQAADEAFELMRAVNAAMDKAYPGAGVAINLECNPPILTPKP